MPRIGNRELIRVNVMLNKPLLKELDRFAELKLEDRSTAIRQLISEGLKEKKILTAIEQFKEGNMTFRETCSLAGLDYWEMQFELDKRKIPFMRSLTLAKERTKNV